MSTWARMVLSPGIKVEFFPQDTYFALSPSNGDVYMHPQMLVFGPKLLLIKFVRSILNHFRIASS